MIRVALKVFCLSIAFSAFAGTSYKLFSKQKMKYGNRFESSGLAYSGKTDTFFVVSDTGDFSEIDKNGKVIGTWEVGGDLEGITVVPFIKDTVFLIDEKAESLIRFNYKKDEIVQTYDLVANPKKVFRSSSNGAITGSVALFSDFSPRAKDLDPTFEVVEEGYSDDFIELARQAAFNNDAGLHGVNAGPYLDLVNKHPIGDRQSKRQEVLRFIPGTKPNKNQAIKSTVKKVLFPYYKHAYQDLEWAYTNYNSIHFFNSSTTPPDTALIYPAFSSSTGIGDVNQYAPSSSFSFDFYVKPKVSIEDPPGSEFHAGTILHMSSCYAISIVSGSSVGPDGKSDKFRILFQLSQSADIAPSKCALSEKTVSSPTGIDPGFLFATSDNSLKRDEWHHVSINWSGGMKNGGTGSIHIDAIEDKLFVITSSSAMQSTGTIGGSDDPNALFVGNYYEGNNAGVQSISRFFNADAVKREGITGIVGSGSIDGDPEQIVLSHPLQAEIHELKIFDKPRNLEQIKTLQKSGASLSDENLVFYVPPFFVQETRPRSILQTPFMEHSSSDTFTNDPFNVSLSFGVGGLEINLENFTREFVKKEYPRLFNMTSSHVTTTESSESKTSDDIMYSSGSSINRLYSILPCDNGKLVPNFQLLQTSSLLENKFVDSFQTTRLDLISLENMVSTSSLPVGLTSIQTVPARTITDTGVLTIPDAIDASGGTTTATGLYGTGSFLFEMTGGSPEDPSVAPGSILTVLQRTGDPSSNQVVFFDASNMFYGDKIRPGSVLIEDLNPTGSNGSFQLKLRDNKYGSIYRADALSENATWASVGNVLYGDGIIILKSPHLSFFGKEDFRITFEGERKVYVFEVSVPVPQNLFNSSSNPQYKRLSPTNNHNESADAFTYVTGLQLHDDNFNVIARAHLAQPFVKREEDRVVIKLRMDY